MFFRQPHFLSRCLNIFSLANSIGLACTLRSSFLLAHWALEGGGGGGKSRYGEHSLCALKAHAPEMIVGLRGVKGEGECVSASYVVPLMPCSVTMTCMTSFRLRSSSMYNLMMMGLFISHSVLLGRMRRPAEEAVAARLLLDLAAPVAAAAAAAAAAGVPVTLPVEVARGRSGTCVVMAIGSSGKSSMERKSREVEVVDGGVGIMAA